MAHKTYDEFMAKYAPDGRVVAEVDATRTCGPDGDLSPFIIVRDGPRTVVINPLSFADYLCIDVHSFTDGQDAVASVFGMTEGRQFNLMPTGLVNYGRPAAHLIAVLIGEPR